MSPISTVYDRFREWGQAGVFEFFWQQKLCDYDETAGIQWKWQSVDGCMTKAPLGGEAVGPNPTDRAKSGTKRSLLTDAAGIPLALAVGRLTYGPESRSVNFRKREKDGE